MPANTEMESNDASNNDDGRQQKPPHERERRRSSIQMIIHRISSLFFGEGGTNANTKNSNDNDDDNNNNDMNTKINAVVAQLTALELETAARADYDYLKEQQLTTAMVSNTSPNRSTVSTGGINTIALSTKQHDEERNRYARRLIHRYIESKKGNVDVALVKIKNTLQFRQKIHIDDLITAFDDHQKNDDEKSTYNKTTATMLKHHLSSKKYYVQGYDKYGRSTLYFVPRNVTEHDTEWTIKEAIYSMERALACSKSVGGTMNAIVDFTGFSITKHSPPVDIGKQFLTTLRNHYAGQIHKIYLVNTPYSFSILWNIFGTFVGTNTHKKITMVNSVREKRKHVLKLYDIEEVPTWLIPGGQNNRAIVDIDDYLYALSFDTAFR